VSKYETGSLGVFQHCRENALGKGKVLDLLPGKWRIGGAFFSRARVGGRNHFVAGI
jgi:hypothetical protein